MSSKAHCTMRFSKQTKQVNSAYQLEVLRRTDLVKNHETFVALRQKKCSKNNLDFWSQLASKKRSP